jgi:hypothetical protein
MYDNSCHVETACTYNCTVRDLVQTITVLFFKEVITSYYYVLMEMEFIERCSFRLSSIDADKTSYETEVPIWFIFNIVNVQRELKLTALDATRRLFLLTRTEDVRFRR